MEKEAQKKKPEVVKKLIQKKRAPVRMWVKSVFLGFRRSVHHQNMNQALLKLEGVNDKKESQFYFGKKCAYIYRTKAHKQNHAYKVQQAIWGKIMSAHGNNGTVKARFNSNLPSRAMGAHVRVMLYPHRFQE